METVNDRELTDESIYPDEDVLKAVLGRSFRAYRALLDLYDRNGMQWEWRYYRDGKAWLCKVRKKKNTIVWMSAWKGHMKAAVYLPERLLEELFTLPLADETVERIRNTANVGRSKPCIFEVRNQKVLKDLERVIQFKVGAK